MPYRDRADPDRQRGRPVPAVRLACDPDQGRDHDPPLDQRLASAPWSGSSRTATSATSSISRRCGYTIAGNPIIMFSVIFGLSMDYEVLLLSRIQEAYRRTGDNTASVAEGLARTAGVITGAALIMVSVFAAFALADTITIKSIGVGMAIAVLLDATIVRVLLVPATMRLLGRWNWWAPGPLKRFADRLGFDHVEDTEPVWAGGPDARRCSSDEPDLPAGRPGPLPAARIVAAIELERRHGRRRGPGPGQVYVRSWGWSQDPRPGPALDRARPGPLRRPAPVRRARAGLHIAGSAAGRRGRTGLPHRMGHEPGPLGPLPRGLHPVPVAAQLPDRPRPAPGRSRAGRLCSWESACSSLPWLAGGRRGVGWQAVVGAILALVGGADLVSALVPGAPSLDTLIWPILLLSLGLLVIVRSVQPRRP